MIGIKSKASIRPTPPRRWTFAEMEAELPETNTPTELWDGELVISPSPSFFHQEIVIRFHDVLRAWVAPRRLGKTGIAPLDMVLTSRRAVQPDVFFLAKERPGILGDRLRGAADLVVEVLSPDSRRRDRIDKRDLYEQHAVKEYWLVDPDAQTVEVLFLERGAYRLVGRWSSGGQAVSRLLPGFAIRVSDLLGNPSHPKGKSARVRQRVCSSPRNYEHGCSQMLVAARTREPGNRSANAGLPLRQ